MTPSKNTNLVKGGGGVCTYQGTLRVLLSFKKPASTLPYTTALTTLSSVWVFTVLLTDSLTTVPFPTIPTHTHTHTHTLSQIYYWSPLHTHISRFEITHWYKIVRQRKYRSYQIITYGWRTLSYISDEQYISSCGL
jgi:hypothetical protein